MYDELLSNNDINVKIAQLKDLGSIQIAAICMPANTMPMVRSKIIELLSRIAYKKRLLNANHILRTSFVTEISRAIQNRLQFSIPITYFKSRVNKY